MTFKDIFTVVYAIPCGVQLGQDFVKRPTNIGAGAWVSFWESVFESDPGDIEANEELNSRINHLEEVVYDMYDANQLLRDEKQVLQTELESVERELSDLMTENTELLKKIDRLEEDAAEANYALGQKFGDRI